MEENVALNTEKQKKFVKSIRGIKKLIKKNEKNEPQKKDDDVETPKPFSMRLKGGKINKKKRVKGKERGLVYLSHIPHGFYEHEMTQYFKQFGVVTNARVIRSKKTGNSKGFAFVEFKEPAVGQIVAETMNNYLMGKRLIKASYIPPEEQRKAYRKNWNAIENPGSQHRLKLKKAFNTDKDEAGEIKRAKKLLDNLNKNKKKLAELGINYDFFAPVDVPEALLNDVVKQEKEENDDNKTEVKKLKKVKRGTEANDTTTQEDKPKKAKKVKQESQEINIIAPENKPKKAKKVKQESEESKNIVEDDKPNKVKNVKLPMKKDNESVIQNVKLKLNKVNKAHAQNKKEIVNEKSLILNQFKNKKANRVDQKVKSEKAVSPKKPKFEKKNQKLMKKGLKIK